MCCARLVCGGVIRQHKRRNQRNYSATYRSSSSSSSYLTRKRSIGGALRLLSHRTCIAGHEPDASHQHKDKPNTHSQNMQQSGSRSMLSTTGRGRTEPLYCVLLCSIVCLLCFRVLALDRLCQKDWATQNCLRNEYVEEAPLGLCFMKRAHEILDS